METRTASLQEVQNERFQLAEYLKGLDLVVCGRADVSFTYRGIHVPKWRNTFRLMRKTDPEFLTFIFFGHEKKIRSWPRKRRIVGELDFSSPDDWVLHVYGEDELSFLRSVSCLISCEFKKDVALHVHEDRKKEELPQDVPAASPAL